MQVDVLINALQAFKKGMAQEATLRRRRLRELERRTRELDGDGYAGQTALTPPAARVGGSAV